MVGEGLNIRTVSVYIAAGVGCLSLMSCSAGETPPPVPSSSTPVGSIEVAGVLFKDTAETEPCATMPLNSGSYLTSAQVTEIRHDNRTTHYKAAKKDITNIPPGNTCPATVYFSIK